MTIITTIARDFRAELDAARAAEDWDAAERIWEERRLAAVERDEAQLIQHPAPSNAQVSAYLVDYYAKHYPDHTITLTTVHASAEADLADIAVDTTVYLAKDGHVIEDHQWTVWTEDVGNGPFTYGEW